MRTLAVALGVALAACTIDAPTYEPLGDDDGDGGPPPGPHVQVTPSELTLGEGDQVVVHVRLSAPPPHRLDVEIAPIDLGRLTASPATLKFDNGNWNVERAVTLLAAPDDDALDQLIAVVFSGAGVLADGHTMVTVTDDDELQLFVTPETRLGVAEGESAPVQVRLTARPPAPVMVRAATSVAGSMAVAPAVLTFTPSTWNVDQSVTVTGAQDDDVTDDVVQLLLDPDLEAMTNHAVEVTVIDDDVLNVQATPGNLGTIEEGGAPASFTVRLTQQPPSVVTLALAVAPTGAASLDRASLVFDRTSWAMPQTVQVTALQDADVADEPVTITLSGAGLVSRTVTAMVDDDDTQAILAAPSQIAGLGEGSATTLAVRLAFQPEGPTVVDVSSLDPTRLAVEPAELTFTPDDYAATQAVRITALHDDDTVDGAEVVRLHEANEGLVRDVPVGIDDDDVQALLVDPTSLSIGEAGSATIAVRLAFRPDGDVTVSVASSDPGEVALGAASVTFTPADYATAMPITVSGVDDPDADDETATVTLDASGVAPRTVAVTVDDDDSQGIVVASTLTVPEGGAASLEVRLAAQPSGAVTVSLAASPGGVVALSASSLTFDDSNWSTAQAVMVSAPHDDDNADASATITATAPGLDARSVAVTVDDDE